MDCTLLRYVLRFCNICYVISSAVTIMSFWKESLLQRVENRWESFQIETTLLFTWSAFYVDSCFGISTTLHHSPPTPPSSHSYLHNFQPVTTQITKSVSARYDALSRYQSMTRAAPTTMLVLVATLLWFLLNGVRVVQSRLFMLTQACTMHKVISCNNLGFLSPRWRKVIDKIQQCPCGCHSSWNRGEIGPFHLER